jgi:hypothetical protein
MHEARTVTATFAINTYAITCNTVGTGTCAANPATVNDGSTTNITVSPAAGWHVVSVVDTVDGPKAGSYTTSAMHEARTVTATFAINTYAITCNVVGTGTCTANPATVNDGDTSTITVTPAAGWYLLSVADSVDGVKTGSYTTSAVHEARTVTATFSALTAIPNLIGMSADDAAAALTTAGLTSGTVTQRTSATAALGRVMSQHPAALTLVMPNSAVEYVVSLGPPLSLAYGAGNPLVVTPGARAELTVTPVNAHGIVHFQWCRVSPTQTLDPIHDENSATLIIDNVTPESAGEYVCEGTDDYDSIQSPHIELAVDKGLSAVGWVGLVMASIVILSGGLRFFERQRRSARL